MSLCKYCGSEVSDESEICLSCRRIIDVIRKEAPPQRINGFDANDVKKNKSLSCIAYLPFLFILPLLLSPKSKYALYHAGYGFRLTVLGIVFKITDILLKIFLNVFFKSTYNEGTAFEYSAVNETGAMLSFVFGTAVLVIYSILLIAGVFSAYKCLVINLPKIKSKDDKSDKGKPS